MIRAVQRAPRVGDRHHARRDAVRRLRPAPARLGARRRDRQLPRRPRPLRAPAARRGGARRVRRPDRRRGRAPRRDRPPASPRRSCARRWRRTRPSSRGTPAAHDAIRFLLLHPDLPVAARPGYWSLVAAAIGAAAGRRAPRAAAAAPCPLADRTAARAAARSRPGTIRWAMALRPRRGARAAARRPAMSLADRWPLARPLPDCATSCCCLGPGGLPRPAPPRRRCSTGSTLLAAAGPPSTARPSTSPRGSTTPSTTAPTTTRSAPPVGRARAAGDYADEVARLVRMTVHHRPADDDASGLPRSATPTWRSWPRPGSATTPTWPGCARTSRTSPTPTSGPAARRCCSDLAPGRTLFQHLAGARAVGGRRAGEPPRASSRSSRASAVAELEVDREAVVPVAGARDLDDAAVGHGTAGVAQDRVALGDLEDRGLLGARAVGADGVLDLGRAQAP